MSDKCPCGSGLSYNDCCKAVIKGTKKAGNPEALMRARYSAYVKSEIDFIVNSCASSDGIDWEATKRWSEKAEWKGLKILGTEKGTASDSEGTVEFVATYVLNGLKDEHHESARFVKSNEAWLYDSGVIKTATIMRDKPKLGRNEACPCGSGKKYKQCCGK
ncbi:YchJ family protein [Spirochaetota bacterium]